MSEPTITKRCSKCKQIKPIEEFCKNKRYRDGYYCWCNICENLWHKKYRQSDKGKAVCRRYRQTAKYKTGHKLYSHTDKAKAARKRYRKSKEGKTARKRYRNSKKGKIVHSRAHRKYDFRNPEKIKAKRAVYYAVKIGKLPKVKTLQCYLCFESAQQYHHYLGYEPKHYLDVLPVCRKCHRKIHKPNLCS